MPGPGESPDDTKKRRKNAHKSRKDAVEPIPAETQAEFDQRMLSLTDHVHKWVEARVAKERRDAKAQEQAWVPPNIPALPTDRKRRAYTGMDIFQVSAAAPAMPSEVVVGSDGVIRSAIGTWKRIVREDWGQLTAEQKLFYEVLAQEKNEALCGDEDEDDEESDEVGSWTNPEKTGTPPSAKNISRWSEALANVLMNVLSGGVGWGGIMYLGGPDVNGETCYFPKTYGRNRDGMTAVQAICQAAGWSEDEFDAIFNLWLQQCRVGPEEHGSEMRFGAMARKIILDMRGGAARPIDQPATLPDIALAPTMSPSGDPAAGAAPPTDGAYTPGDDLTVEHTTYDTHVGYDGVITHSSANNLDEGDAREEQDHVREEAWHDQQEEEEQSEPEGQSSGEEENAQQEEEQEQAEEVTRARPQRLRKRKLIEPELQVPAKRPRRQAETGHNMVKAGSSASSAPCGRKKAVNCSSASVAKVNRYKLQSKSTARAAKSRKKKAGVSMPEDTGLQIVTRAGRDVPQRCLGFGAYLERMYANVFGASEPEIGCMNEGGAGGEYICCKVMLWKEDTETPVEIVYALSPEDPTEDITCESLLSGHVLPPFLVDMWDEPSTEWRLVSSYQKLVLDRRHSRILIKTLNVGVTPGLGPQVEILERETREVYPKRPAEGEYEVENAASDETMEPTPLDHVRAPCLDVHQDANAPRDQATDLTVAVAKGPGGGDDNAKCRGMDEDEESADENSENETTVAPYQFVDLAEINRRKRRSPPSVSAFVSSIRTKRLRVEAIGVEPLPSKDFVANGRGENVGDVLWIAIETIGPCSGALAVAVWLSGKPQPRADTQSSYKGRGARVAVAPDPHLSLPLLLLVLLQITLVGHPYKPAPHSEHSEAVRKLCSLGAVDRVPAPPRTCPTCGTADTLLFAFLMYAAPVSGRWKFKCRNCDASWVPPQTGPSDELLQQIRTQQSADAASLQAEREAKKAAAERVRQAEEAAKAAGRLARDNKKAAQADKKAKAEAERIVREEKKLVTRALKEQDKELAVLDRTRAAAHRKAGRAVSAQGIVSMRHIQIIYWSAAGGGPRRETVTVDVEKKLDLSTVAPFAERGATALYGVYYWDADLHQWTPVVVPLSVPEDTLVILTRDASFTHCEGFGTELHVLQDAAVPQGLRKDSLAKAESLRAEIRQRSREADAAWVVFWWQDHVVPQVIKMSLDKERRLFFKTSPWFRTCLGDETLVELWANKETDWNTRSATRALKVAHGVSTVLVRVVGVEGMPGLGVEIEALEQVKAPTRGRSRAKPAGRSTKNSPPRKAPMASGKLKAEESGWESPVEFVEDAEPPAGSDGLTNLDHGGDSLHVDVKALAKPVKQEPGDVIVGDAEVVGAKRKRHGDDTEGPRRLPLGRHNVKRVKLEARDLNWAQAESVDANGILTIDVDLLFGQ
ncbi:hypothetical protein C8Q76DRAFT_804132 [Earliella scabrosa]|nr:hypothetical protein C8Q76DRAFT_804132 [Earliella scabrosa]